MKRYAANLDTTQWKTERRYTYDGVNVVADSGRADSSWTWHVFQGYSRLALADKPGSALRVKYLLNDHLGTANVMVDDTGRVLAKYARDPWGNLESSWESAPLRWQFTGKEQDPEVGGNVFYFNARFYDGERGSFIGRDPKLQFWTPYSYVGNRSLVGVDPSGCVDATVSTSVKWGAAGFGGIESEGNLNLNAWLRYFGDVATNNGLPILGRSYKLAAKTLDVVDLVVTFGNIRDRSSQPIFSASPFNQVQGLGLVAGGTADLDFKPTIGTTGNKEIEGYGAFAVKVGAHGSLSLNFDDNGFSGVSISVGPSGGIVAGGAILATSPIQ